MVPTVNWPETVGQFLIGTARGKGSEVEALNDAAMLTAMRRAGYVGAPSGLSPVEGAETDTLPPFDAGAQDLKRCLDEGEPLVQEWCRLAAARGWRVPEIRLAEVIDFVRRHPQTRDAVRPVLGERGLWLAAQNPSWAKLFSLAPEIDADEARRIWDEGTVAERKAVLVALTRKDPALRRELIESSWKQEPAKNRVEFVEAFGEGIWPEDEPFLTRCLADRSMDVRFTAALCLSFVRENPVAVEIFEVAREFVKFGPPMQIGAPEMDDARLDRFGIASVKGPVKLDERLSRLTRLVSLVAPWRWESDGDRPASLTARFAVQDQRGHALRRGLLLAARFHQDAGWATALVESENPQTLDGDAPLHLIPREAQERIARALWASGNPHAPYRFASLALTGKPWSPEFTRWFMDQMKRELLAQQSRVYEGSLRPAAYFMDLGAAQLPYLEPAPAWRNAYETWQRVLDLRRSIHSTFERSPKP